MNPTQSLKVPPVQVRVLLGDGDDLQTIEHNDIYGCEWPDLPSNDYGLGNVLEPRPNVSRKRHVNYAAIVLSFEAGCVFAFILLRVLESLWGAQ